MFSYHLVWFLHCGGQAGLTHKAATPSQLLGSGWSWHKCQWWCIVRDANLDVTLLSVIPFDILHVTWHRDLTVAPGLRVSIHVSCWLNETYWLLMMANQAGMGVGTLTTAQVMTILCITYLQPACSIVTHGLSRVLLCFHFTWNKLVITQMYLLCCLPSPIMTGL